MFRFSEISVSSITIKKTFFFGGGGKICAQIYHVNDF